MYILVILAVLIIFYLFLNNTENFNYKFPYQPSSLRNAPNVHTQNKLMYRRHVIYEQDPENDNKLKVVRFNTIPPISGPFVRYIEIPCDERKCPDDIKCWIQIKI